MNQGAITSNIDVAQVTLYLFWLFFAGLIVYLRREDKREGYPLEDQNAAPGTLREGFPSLPTSKTFKLAHGGVRERPAHWVPSQALPDNAMLGAKWPGAPLEPIGDPFAAGVGPGSWANRPDELDLTVEGEPKIVPLRVDPAYSIDARDPDPRGKNVVGGDGEIGGKVTDIWVDRSERLFRYLEVEVAGGRHVLLPVNFSKISKDGVSVRSILAKHFAGVPGLRNPNQVTMLEEEKVVAYYGAGTLYAKPTRMGPLL
jgi:photosynthetic reaction center H subunit